MAVNMSDLEILLTKAASGAPGVITIYLIYWVTKRLTDVLDRLVDRVGELGEKVDKCPSRQ